MFDVIGVAQEGIHSIKLKKQCAIMLNLDLQEAYDRVGWSFFVTLSS